MSATEVIELFKKLPPEEQAVVLDYVQSSSPCASAKQVRYATDEEFDAVTDRVFKENSELLRRLAQ
jgi:hypothetical protein